MTANTGSDELKRILLKCTANSGVMPKRIAEAKAALIAWRDADIAMLRADLAWCLGKLRGLGYPAEHLEKQYAMGEAAHSPQEPDVTQEKL